MRWPLHSRLLFLRSPSVPRNDSGRAACAADALGVRTHPDLEGLRHGSFVKAEQQVNPFSPLLSPVPHDKCSFFFARF